MSDERTRDLLRSGALGERARLGERTLRRVGGRQWDRPNVFVSADLYRRCGLADPWGSDGGRGHDAIGIGPVSLRLGEPKRQPAPHLRPKEPKAKKQADPLSKWRRPASTPTQSAAPSPRPAPTPAPAPAPAPKSRKATPSDRSRSPSPSSRPVPAGRSAAPPSASEAPAGFTPTPDRVERGMFRNKVKRGLKAPIPVRPELRDGREAKAPAPKAAVVPPPKPPKTPTPAAKRSRRSNRGRLSARPQQRAVELGGPEVVELARPVARPSVLDLGPPEVVSDSRPQPSPASAPVDRRPPGKPIGLDDLFGGSPEGRVRMRSRKLASGEADETSEA